MSFIDRFRRQTADPAVPQSQDEVTVPDGHKVTVYQTRPLPCVANSNGGICIACQGSSSDEPEAELERLQRDADNAIRSNRSRVVMSGDARRISELFAPADPAIHSFDGVLLWILDPAIFVASNLGPTLLQMLLRNLYTIGINSRPPLAQFACMPEFASPGGRLLAELVGSLGVPVRECDPNTGAVLVEVHRPEGIIVSVLPGRLFARSQGEDQYVRQINQEKDRAEEEGDVDKLRKLEEQEREELAKRLAPARGKGTRPVTRATHLRRLLLEVGEGGAAAWQALCEDLLRREFPLLVIVDPKTRGAMQRTWPEKRAAMPAYPDEASLMRTARDLGMPMESFGVAEMTPRDLFCWMGKQQSAVAINVYRDDKTPLYVWLRPEAVQALSEGKVPQYQPEMCH